MDDAGGVQVLDAAQHLVEEVRHALVVQIHLDHLAQVRVHQLHHQIHVLKLVQRPLRRERVQETDYLEGGRVVNRPWIQQEILDEITIEIRSPSAPFPQITSSAFLEITRNCLRCYFNAVSTFVLLIVELKGLEVRVNVNESKTVD